MSYDDWVTDDEAEAAEPRWYDVRFRLLSNLDLRPGRYLLASKAGPWYNVPPATVIMTLHPRDNLDFVLLELAEAGNFSNVRLLDVTLPETR